MKTALIPGIVSLILGILGLIFVRGGLALIPIIFIGVPCALYTEHVGRRGLKKKEAGARRILILAYAGLFALLSNVFPLWQASWR